MSDFGKRVAAQIRKLRKNAGLTQAELAERLGSGCAVETVSRFERAASEPSFEWLERIGTALGTDVDGLLSEVLAGRASPVVVGAEFRRVVALLDSLEEHELRGVRKLVRAYVEVVRFDGTGG